MRDSNHRSITANRAAVTISTTLYDRRALDCTSAKPLVNSLNHLTFLASSSGKVRETLSNDGGLERLVDILYDCQVDEHNVNPDENPLVAWKWSLAFQCLVLVGTRGTEAIRKKVVDAGMIPVIATVLDNYLAMNADNGPHAPSGFGHHDYAFGAGVGAGVAATPPARTPNGFQIARDDDEMDFADQPLDTGAAATAAANTNTNTNSTTTGAAPNPSRNTNTRSATTDDVIEGLGTYKKRTNNRPFHSCPDNIGELKDKIELIHKIVHLTTDSSIQDDDLSLAKLIDFVDDENFSVDAAKRKFAKFKKNRRQLVDLTAPRNFINGILVPREDDVLWSLQLLAFISKYSYLKPILSETNIISGMSLRSPPPQQDDLLSFKGNFSNSVPALENDDNDNDNDNELEEVISVDNEKKDDYDEIMIDTDGDNNAAGQHRGVSAGSSNNDTVLANKLDLLLPLDVKLKVDKARETDFMLQYSSICAEASNFEKLTNFVEKMDSMEDGLAKARAYVKLDKILNKDLKHESVKFKNLRIRHHQLRYNNIKAKWNYETYPYYDNLEEDQDQSIKPLEMLNIFPLVEKFTVKSYHSKEIHYWAGVIMRNSCRRDEAKGGVRQCACFDCGRWEDYPRQFAKCRRCKRTKYCSKECQSNAWEYHKHWCVQTASSSSTAPSTSAATVTSAPHTITNNMIIDGTNARAFATNAHGPQAAQQAQAAAQQQQQHFLQAASQAEDNESVNSSINTTTTTAMLRQHQPPQQLMTTPLGAFVSPAALSLGANTEQPSTRATTPISQPPLGPNVLMEPMAAANMANTVPNASATPILAANNYRGVNFGTIAFHNAVHATLAATNNNNNLGAGAGAGATNRPPENRSFNFGAFGNSRSTTSPRRGNDNSSNDDDADSSNL